MTIYLVLLVAVIVGLVVYIVMLKQEIRYICKALKNNNQTKQQKKIFIRLFDKDVEEMVFLINLEMNRLKVLELKERANEQKLVQAMSHISHDLRTPITSILGYTQFIKRSGTKPERQKEYLNIIEERTLALNNSISCFFDLINLERDDYLIELNSVNFTSVFMGLITMYYQIFEETKRNVIVNFPDHDIYVLGNEVSLHRVLENLLSNVSKHSIGEVSIQLIEGMDKQTFILENEVKNIAAIEVSKWFDNFYVQDSSRNSNNSNTGLGLGIAKRLVEKMGGTMISQLIDDRVRIICEFQPIKKPN